MGNQQVSSIKTIALNAVFGDGCLWKHPECINCKVVFTSTNKSLLEAKQKLCPSIFPAKILSIRKAGVVKGVTNNAKELFVLQSLVHPLFTKYKTTQKLELIKELTLFDFALWYLDDGCCIRRKPYFTYRFFLCIGNTCETVEMENVFMKQVKELFPNQKNYGTIKKNNSKASIRNKNWVIPVPIAKIIIAESAKFCVIDGKLPYRKTSETIL